MIQNTWSENYGTGGGAIDHDILQINRLEYRPSWYVPEEKRDHILSSFRSSPIGTGPCTNVLRGIHVLIRLPVGFIPSRMSKFRIYVVHYLSGVHS